MQAQAQETGIDICVIAPPEVPQIQGDANKIKQAVLNLISNAIKYNRPNGEITLAVENGSDEVTIFVKDTGIGIPEKHMKRLFTKFYRVPGSEQHAQGTGLGLSIVKRIVEGHGGDIGVESVLGEGTTFKIRLPLTHV
jgi:two-component system phosphate regulon sensor histidine kinase PhoR